jgi:hypothetical protein
MYSPSASLCRSSGMVAHDPISPLGMEGFVVGDVRVYPSMSRIADWSAEEPESAYDHARRH